MLYSSRADSEAFYMHVCCMPSLKIVVCCSSRSNAAGGMPFHIVYAHAIPPGPMALLAPVAIQFLGLGLFQASSFALGRQG